MINAASITQKVTPQTPGAGRTYDWHWPVFLGVSSAVAQARYGPNTGISCNEGTTAPGAFTINADAGVAVTRLTPGASPGAGWIQHNTRVMWFTEQTVGQLACARACWEHRFTGRYDDPTGVIAGDTGVCITMGTTGAMNGGGGSTNPGAMFGPSDVGKWALRARAVNGAGYSIDEVLSAANTPAPNTYHTSALRVVSGQQGVDPYLVGVIDGVEVTQRYPWTAAGGVLPGPDAYSAANVGYAFGWACNPVGLLATVSVVEVAVIAAETVDGLQ